MLLRMLVDVSILMVMFWGVETVELVWVTEMIRWLEPIKINKAINIIIIYGF